MYSFLGISPTYIAGGGPNPPPIFNRTSPGVAPALKDANAYATGSELQGISPPPIALTENPEHAEGELPHLLQLLGPWSAQGKNTGKRVSEEYAGETHRLVERVKRAEQKQSTTYALYCRH
jgi:hypothetical protein